MLFICQRTNERTFSALSNLLTMYLYIIRTVRARARLRFDANVKRVGVEMRVQLANDRDRRSWLTKKKICLLVINS